jgi:hypothetical protein
MRTADRGEVAELVKDLRRQASLLEADLAGRAAAPEFDPRLRAEYDRARQAKRTATGYPEWLAGRVTQAAAAWVLATVFVRYCEDNELIEWPFIAGPGERLIDAEERHEAFFREHPDRNDRDWLLAAFDHLAGTNDTVAGLFDRRHNPLWDITPSYEAAGVLLAFWRRRGLDGETRWHFDGWDTRFLGDVYQDLSEHARKTYALLQTPDFLEEFILDLTLTPAIEEFGLDGLRTIDPTCGSGHFLLGLFRRILEQWREVAPGTDDWELIKRSLGSVHGVDKNPFAVSVARFRLLVAVLQAAGIKRLDQAPVFPINIAVGDSLIHGRGAPRLQKDDAALFDLADAEEPREHTYTTEDVDEFAGVDLLGRGSYHVVVGNPPYITVKDKQENESYRARYDACSGTYALSVPFAQRFFQPAVKTSGSDGDRAAGFVGQITANSFMKREFGKKLIEQFFPTVHLTHIIDTSGAYIPGHGTPTVILVGRNHFPRDEKVRAVLGVRGEPSQPDDPAKGLVWMSIATHYRELGWEDEWITVADLERLSLGTHPWTLSGGGAVELKERIERAGSGALSIRIESAGFMAVTREDDAYFLGSATLRCRGVDRSFHRPLSGGAGVRDWSVTPDTTALLPYSSEGKASLDEAGKRLLWPATQHLLVRRALSGTQLEQGLTWFEYSQLSQRRFLARWLLVFPFVSTHPHFALVRRGILLIRTAPVIKLPEGASEDDHLALLGVLNSSTACFWLKQVSQAKAGGGTGRGMQDEAWEERYEFTGTKLQEFPLPDVLPLQLGRALDGFARDLAEQEPAALRAREVPTRQELDRARHLHELVRQRMIALQEELDWQVYGSYGLLTDAEVAASTIGELHAVPEVKLGERAFEIVLARQVAAGEAETAWFARHGSTPVTEIPEHWPAEYRSVVQARIELIEKRRDLALIERPECKRRWSIEPWEKREREALKAWLLDRCENRDLWFTLREGFEQPRPLTVSQLADQFRGDEDLQAVARLYATDHLGKRDATLAQVLESVIVDQHVPYLAALRYKDSGLAKRAEWERVWELQREEDRTGERRDIAVPPKYKPADFAKVSYWAQRGKLDVPKERFISYPGAGPDADPTLLLGWAGWDHKDQAQVLVNLVNDRSTDAGWGVDRLTPLLAGLQEVLPWVRQWHGSYDPEWQGIPAEDLAGFMAGQRTRHALTEEALRDWRPVAAGRGRRAARKDGEQ